MGGNARRSRSRAVCTAASLVAATACIATEYPDAPNDPGGAPAPRPPVGISAEPGPIARSITISWPFVDEAQLYALYWDTIPELTRGTARRALGAAPPFLHQDRETGRSYYYMVSAVSGDSEGEPGPVVDAMPKEFIGIHVQSPLPGTQTDEVIPFTVGLNSPAAVASLTASAGTITSTLTFQSNIGLYTGTLTIPSGGSPSTQRVSVRATDVQNRSAQANIVLRHDRAPAVEVLAPDDSATVERSTRIAAACDDDAPTGCASIVAFVEFSSGGLLASGIVALDRVVSLAAYAGQNIRIIFEGTDSVGQKTRVVRFVRVQ